MYEYNYNGYNGANMQPMGMMGYPPLARPQLSSSRVWYAATVPAIALFIELYANSIFLGAFLWIFAVISCIAACVLDRRYLRDNGLDLTALPAFLAFIPPVYMFRRAARLNERSTPAIVFIVMFIYALTSNGFSKAAAMNTDGMISQVKDNYWFSVSSFESVNSTDTIGTALDSYAKEKLGEEELEWTAERSSDKIYVNAKYVGKSFELHFEIPFDGYAFGSIKITEAVIDKKSYKDKKAEEKLKEILDDLSDSSSDSE